MDIKLSRIISLVPDRDVIDRALDINANDPDGLMQLNPLAVDDIHVTLWKLTNAERQLIGDRWDEIRSKLLATIPRVTVNDALVKVHRPEQMGPKGTIPTKLSALLMVKEQDVLRAAVDGIATMVGIQLSPYEQDRPFHISVANLTGSPFDSVGDVQRFEVDQVVGRFVPSHKEK